jgi:hypothetical protein
MHRGNEIFPLRLPTSIITITTTNTNTITITIT